MNDNNPEDLNVQFEVAVGEVYRVLFQMRQTKMYRDEYESMSALYSMLQRDMLALIQKYGKELERDYNESP